MFSRTEKKPVVITATAPPTAEHRKARRAGRIAFCLALALLVTSVVALLSGFSVVASTAGGLCVALVVIGLMLHYEGERQRQRADASRPNAGEEPTSMTSRTYRRI